MTREEWLRRYARLVDETERWLLMVGYLPVECHCGRYTCLGWRMVKCWEAPELVRKGELSQAELDAAHAFVRTIFFPKY